MKKINFYLICLICFALPSYLVRFSIFGIPTTLLEVLIYLSTLLTLVSCIKYRELSIKNKELSQDTRYKIQDTKIWIPIALFLLSGIIGILVSPEKSVALGQFKAFMLNPILFFWVIISNVKTKDQIKTLLYSFFASGIYVSIYSIYQYLSGQLTPDDRIIGLFGYSPNYLAFYLMPLVIVAIFDLIENFKSRTKILNIIEILSIILSLVAIYLSGSRAAILALIGAIILGYIIKYLILTKIKWYFKTIVIIIVVVASLVIGWQFTKPNFNLTPEEGGRITASNNIRAEIWNTTVKDILIKNGKWLWGVGLGNYQPYFTGLTKNRVNYSEWISPKALTAHNLFLQTWVNLGILGVLSMLAILIIWLKNVKITSLASFGIFVAFLAILIQGMVDTPYWKNDLAVLWWLFGGIILILSGIAAHHEKIS